LGNSTTAADHAPEKTIDLIPKLLRDDPEEG